MCGKKSDFPVCDDCAKDEKKQRKFFRKLAKKKNWFSKTMAMIEPDAKARLYYVPHAIDMLGKEMVEEEKKAVRCHCFGVFGVYDDNSGTYVVHKRIVENELNPLQDKMLILSIAKHFEQQAEIEK